MGMMWVSAMIGGGAKSCDFSVVTRKNEEDSRSTEQKSKEPSKTYIDHVFLEGGKIIQVPPTEVAASGGRWGSGGQDQQSCGHKMKLHFFCWPKFDTKSAIFDEWIGKRWRK